MAATVVHYTFCQSRHEVISYLSNGYLRFEHRQPADQGLQRNVILPITERDRYDLYDPIVCFGDSDGTFCHP
jgi:hypothetical protein